MKLLPVWNPLVSPSPKLPRRHLAARQFSRCSLGHRWLILIQLSTNCCRQIWIQFQGLPNPFVLQFVISLFQIMIDQGVKPYTAKKQTLSLLKSSSATQALSSGSSTSSSSQASSSIQDKISVDELMILLQENPDWLTLSERSLAIEANCTQYTARTAKQKYQAKVVVNGQYQENNQ